MRAVHPAGLSIEDLRKETDIKHTRGSGPGGQHRNRAATEVQLRHRPTGIRAAAGERRSQAANLKVAWFRLRKRLALEYRSPLAQNAPQPRDYQASDLWRGRVQQKKICVNLEHTDFPTLLAEVLDLFHAWECDEKATAEALGITRTQLVRFVGESILRPLRENQKR